MPNGPVHRRFGAGVGTGMALVKALDQRPAHLLLEGVGGTIGGMVGARLPDMLDLPTSPNHRSTAHAVLPVSVAGVTLLKNVDQMQSCLRQYADEFANAGAQSSSSLESAYYSAMEVLFRLAVGMIPGLLAGYASHLVLDSRSAKGLPVLK